MYFSSGPFSSTAAEQAARNSVQLLEVPGTESKPQSVTFSTDNPKVFLVAEARTWSVFVYVPHTARGPAVQLLGSMDAAKGALPLLLQPGSAIVQLDSSAIATQVRRFWVP